ncbi:hypothetical protein NC652_022460 [Populus alba x Populus x berolinensis]|nr:hypothetical protein NC652_022460 [Populus alba x Populus x berolinensis]
MMLGDLSINKRSFSSFIKCVKKKLLVVLSDLPEAGHVSKYSGTVGPELLLSYQNGVRKIKFSKMLMIRFILEVPGLLEEVTKNIQEYMNQKLGIEET